MQNTSPDKHFPILYSFRRCPYAMRARLAIKVAGFQCELREIVLRDKAPQLLQVSPKGTVPVLLLPEGRIIEESLEIMLYVLAKHDPESWLPASTEQYAAMTLIKENDGPFKSHLDRTKYPDRFRAKGEAVNVEREREEALGFLIKLDGILSKHPFLAGTTPGLADMAILPFVRQFVNIDREWFQEHSLKHATRWLDEFLAGALFKSIMIKYEKWEIDQSPIVFPENAL